MCIGLTLQDPTELNALGVSGASRCCIGNRVRRAAGNLKSSFCLSVSSPIPKYLSFMQQTSVGAWGRAMYCNVWVLFGLLSCSPTSMDGLDLNNKTAVFH